MKRPRGLEPAPRASAHAPGNRRSIRIQWHVGIMVALALLLAFRPLIADEEIEIAVPADGRITLGVFDGAGKLVRVLHRLAKEDDFQIGLNGLITTWDGKDDAGRRVPPGSYYVRGYLVGEEVRVSGENFLFNDWAADAGYPNFHRIKDFSLLENGDVLLLTDGGPSGNLLSRFSQADGFLWSVGRHPHFPFSFFVSPRPYASFSTTDVSGRPLGGSIIQISPSAPPPDFPPLLATNSTNAFVLTPNGLTVHSLEDGSVLFNAPTDGDVPLAIAANDSTVFVGSRVGFLTSCPLPLKGPHGETTKSSVVHPPFPTTSLAADASRLLGASPVGVWIRKDAFVPIPLPVTVKDIALGTSDTFWFVGVEQEAALVGQASFAGEILRLLRPAADDPKPEKIRASRSVEKFAVLESAPALQRLRIMARTERGDWVIEWERTLTGFAHFGFVEGKPIADVGSVPQETNFRVRLKRNPLTGQQGFLTLQTATTPSGTRLVSPDGLPLVEISSRPDILRMVIHRGDNSQSLRVLQGTDSFVEEFSLTGLDDILPLDAGSVDIP